MAYELALMIFQSVTHLAKRSSNLKQNGTQEKTPFSGTFFQTLSCGVINLVASVKKMTL